MKAYDRFHPLPLFCYFLLQIVFSAVVSHPLFRSVSLLGAVFCGFLFFPPRKQIRSVLFSIFLILTLALINPLFSHNGVTVLFYFNSNAVTLESFLYGLFLGIQLAAVLQWCVLYSEVFTSEKTGYLLQRLSSKFALVFSMTLRFIPRYRRELKRLKETQTALGVFSAPSRLDRLRAHFQIFSAMVEKSLEGSMETSLSMQNRGYGVLHHTRYAPFRFRREDGFLFFLIIFLFVPLLILLFRSPVFYYYPRFSLFSADTETVLSAVFYSAFSFLPFITECAENIKWNCYRSRI